MAHFKRHIRKFSDLSKGWGIDKNTYEYWSWLARQYRILAEVLELGLRAGLKLPTHEVSVALPPAFTTLPAEPPPIPETNTSNVLQHPGFYYYEAALSSRERYRRFTAIAEQEVRLNESAVQTILIVFQSMQKQRPSAVSNSAAFLNEQKVDHWSLIIELFSKAYELFKKHTPSGQSRLTFFIALQIATAYHESGKDELAVKFFERIAKTYRKERWKSLLRSVLRMWCESARRLGAVESCLVLMIEMLGLSKYTCPSRFLIFYFIDRGLASRRGWRPLSRYHGNIEGRWTGIGISLGRYSPPCRLHRHPTRRYR